MRAEDARSCSATRGCTLADAPDASYDLIFVDAFIGAAIPIHLLTREAMALYFRKLKPHGIVAMHISNRNLELASVVAGIAEANGAIARVYDGGDVEEDADQHTLGAAGRRGGAHGRGFRRARQVGISGRSASAIPTSACGPTTTPTSSAPCCAT